MKKQYTVVIALTMTVGLGAAGVAAGVTTASADHAKTMAPRASLTPPEGLVQDLARIGIVVEPLAEAPALSRAAAVSASRHFTSVIGTSPVRGTYSARITDLNFAVRPSRGTGASDVGAGALTTRAVWAVVFKGVSMPIFGPAGRDLRPYYSTDLVVFMDAQTGTGLLAVSVPALDSH